MTVKHIYSQQSIEVPAYIKGAIGIYGWLIATYDRKIVFCYTFDDETQMDDVTNHYEKI